MKHSQINVIPAVSVDKSPQSVPYKEVPNTVSQALADKPFFDILAPTAWVHPCVLTSPHSGSYLPPSLVEKTCLPVSSLRQSEDVYVDELFDGCVDNGVPLLRALVSRAYIDLNREPFELDPRMFSGDLPGFVNGTTPRVMSGLGTIPRIVAEGEDIYRCKLDFADATQRIELVYRPFHRTLAALLEEAANATGQAVLLDCHSMPHSAATAGGRMAGPVSDVIIGDRFGHSAAPHLVDYLERLFSEAGLVVRRNRPYAGGFITETYGSPTRNRHAIQIEINRSLYMNERTIAKSANFNKLRSTLMAICVAFFSQLSDDGRAQKMAAE